MNKNSSTLFAVLHCFDRYLNLLNYANALKQRNVQMQDIVEKKHGQYNHHKFFGIISELFLLVFLTGKCSDNSCTCESFACHKVRFIKLFLDILILRYSDVHYKVDNIGKARCDYQEDKGKLH